MSPVGKSYVVSDVHGHRTDLVESLVAAGLTDDDGRWTGGDARLWVLGDLMDRGPDGIGVVRLVRDLQEQAPGQVTVLLGNHEVLALGMHRFPDTPFRRIWKRNGGRAGDQRGLTDDVADWMSGLPVMALAGDGLLVHADTTRYTQLGSTIAGANARAREMLSGGSFEDHFALLGILTSRYDFLGDDGPALAAAMLKQYGGSRVVHGHSIIASLLELTGGDPDSTHVSGPHSYAGGLALAVDGGRYDDGPLLVVPL